MKTSGAVSHWSCKLLSIHISYLISFPLISLRARSLLDFTWNQVWKLPYRTKWKHEVDSFGYPEEDSYAVKALFFSVIKCLLFFLSIIFLFCIRIMGVWILLCCWCAFFSTCGYCLEQHSNVDLLLTLEGSTITLTHIENVMAVLTT